MIGTCPACGEIRELHVVPAFVPGKPIACDTCTMTLLRDKRAKDREQARARRWNWRWIGTGVAAVILVASSLVVCNHDDCSGGTGSNPECVR